MTLHIHVRSHPDELVAELAVLLAATPDDPFATELVAVPTRGIERWLTQRISLELADRTSGGGICANVEFPSPRRLVRQVLLSVPGLAESVSSWEGTALTRHVAALLDSHRDEQWMWLIARYIDAPGAETPLGNGQRMRAAAKIAGLFTRYARRRPDMIRAWIAGEDDGPDGQPLADSGMWQAKLWRMVRAQIDVAALPELLPQSLDPIRHGKVDLDLPHRLSVYGLTALDPMDLEVLEAVAVRRDVHLYLLHPSPALWASTRELLASDPTNAGLPLRATDPTRAEARHPLLRSWAQESSELQLLLAHRGVAADFATDHEPAPTTLLARLQDNIRANEIPVADADLSRAVKEGTDRSIQVHVCYGARRQVEVLRDAILHAFADNPTLQPRHVVIMTPDLATFAPLLEAAFPHEIDRPGTDLADESPPDSDMLPDLRVRIADRAPSATNPLVRFADTVFDLAGSRLETGTIRELLALPVVRRRFRFDTDAADAIAGVIDDINVRWGLDSDHRDNWEAGPNDDHTWRRGLDRALSGVFYADSAVRTVAGIAPLDGVEGSDARPVGLVAHLLDRVVAVREVLNRPRPHSEWGPAIASSVRLLAEPAWGEEWQWAQLERLLEESFPSQDEIVDPDISPAEARLSVAEWSQDAPSPLHFRTGDITVCTLVPMRSVPYRVVCLLGMDDERFPRSSRADGDDLLIDHELVGDTDRGAEDRQLLLDALMAAEDHLIVTYSGRDSLTNAAYPPAVPIADLEDTLHDMVGADGLEHIVTHHPLQSFSDLNFVAGRLGVAGPWAFDPMQLDGALALQSRTGKPPLAVTGFGPVEIPAEVRLDDLIGFLEHPARQFIRVRLGFSIPQPGETPDDILQADLDPLGLWGVTDRILTGLLDGHDIELLGARERATDALPPANLGIDDLQRATQRATDLSEAARRHGHDPRRRVDFAGVVGVGARTVAGSVGADAGQARIDLITPSRLRGKQRLRAFVKLVFLTALDPAPEWQALLIGRHDRGETLRAVTITALGDDPQSRQDRAEDLLASLMDLYVEGMTRPIPLPVETSYVWQRGLATSRAKAFREAGEAWETNRFSPEMLDPANHLLFSNLSDIGALAASGFVDHAARLWGPIVPLLKEKKA